MTWINPKHRYKALTGGPGEPWLTREFIDLFESWDTGNWVGLEWGSGESTLWFARRTKGWSSVEHHAPAVKDLRPRLPQQVRLQHVPVWGDRTAYPMAGVDAVGLQGADFALVDGRRRVRCLAAALLAVRSGGVIALDNAERRYYDFGADLVGRFATDGGQTTNGRWRTDWWRVQPPTGPEIADVRRVITGPNCSQPRGRKLYVKQYGIERSGTNLLKLLLEEYVHARVLSNPLGGKHHAPAELDWDWSPLVARGFTSQYEQTNVKAAHDRGDLGFILSVKNPYAWCISFAEWAERLTKRRVSVTPEAVTKWMGRWNKLHRAWLDFFEGKRAAVVRYEDLLRNPGVELRRVAALFGREAVPGVVRLPDRCLAPMLEHFSRDDGLEDKTFTRRAYYLEGEYMRRYSQPLLKAMRDAADPDVVEALGYSLAGPP